MLPGPFSREVVCHLMPPPTKVRISISQRFRNTGSQSNTNLYPSRLRLGYNFMDPSLVFPDPFVDTCPMPNAPKRLRTSSIIDSSQSPSDHSPKLAQEQRICRASCFQITWTNRMREIPVEGDQMRQPAPQLRLLFQELTTLFYAGDAIPLSVLILSCLSYCSFRLLIRLLHSGSVTGEDNLGAISKSTTLVER